MTLLPVPLPCSAPHPCTGSFSPSHVACSWGTPAPGSRTAHLWDPFAHLHSKQVSENSLLLAGLWLEGKEATSHRSWSEGAIICGSCGPCSVRYLLQQGQLAAMPLWLSLCRAQPATCLSVLQPEQGAQEFTLLSLMSAFFRLSGAWLKRERATAESRICWDAWVMQGRRKDAFSACTIRPSVAWPQSGVVELVKFPSDTRAGKAETVNWSSLSSVCLQYLWQGVNHFHFSKTLH